MSKLDDAKRLLVFYFKKAGVIKDGDNVVEIEEIVDLIADGVMEQVKEELRMQRMFPPGDEE